MILKSLVRRGEGVVCGVWCGRRIVVSSKHNIGPAWCLQYPGTKTIGQSLAQLGPTKDDLSPRESDQ